MQVLIAEDELSTRLMLRFVLEQQAGHRVLEAETGAEALRLLDEQSPDLLLADLNLPDMDGLELVGRVRRTSSIPIMIVSARVTISDRVRALKSGADDYLVKPFDVSELIARTEALLRRVGQIPRVDLGGRVTVGPLSIDQHRQTVEVEGRGRIHLTPTELRLLLEVARSPGQVRSRSDLEQAIAGEPGAMTSGALNTYVSNLRQKLEPDPDEPRLIETVRGKGYRLAL